MNVNPSTYPISWFCDRNRERTLVLKPPYQRKPVWTNKQKAYLIDTILEGYFVPEIYIHREVSSKGVSIYNIVDGQQRIRAILDFIKSEFPLLEEFTPEYADYKFEDLPDSIKMELWGYILYVREITKASEEEVKNLFKRMNRFVVPLNQQELRHATYQGHFIKLVEEVSEDEYWAENRIVTPNEIRRMKDVEFVSLLFISVMHGIQDRTKDLEKYYAMYEEDFEDQQEYKRIFETNLAIIKNLFPDLRATRWKNKSNFYTLFIGLSKLNEKFYIPESNYRKLAKKLLSFSEKVAEINSESRKKLSQYPQRVRSYAELIKKSTTDKIRRGARHKIVYNIMLKYAKKRKNVKVVL